MAAPIPPINITLKMPPIPTSTHSLSDWLPTVLLGIVVVILNHRNAVRLEALKSGLVKDLTEHQTRFSKLHDMRCVAIAEIYGKFQVTKQALIRMAYSVPDLSQMFAEVSGDGVGEAEPQTVFDQRYADLLDCFERSRILLSEDICRQTDSLLHVLFVSGQNVKDSLESGVGAADRSSYRGNAENLMSVSRQLQGQLEGEFRRLLGVVGDAT